MFGKIASKMKQSVLVFLVSSIVALATGVQAQAGHWEWQWNGYTNHPVYVRDDSDNSAYTWKGESSGPAQPPRSTDDGQPLGRTAPPVVRQPSLHDASLIQAEQAARVRYN